MPPNGGCCVSRGTALQVAGAMRGASRLFFICRVTATSFIQASVPGAALSALFFANYLVILMIS
jgi:hypothetical protein